MAALVLGAAGAAKLRSPWNAVRATGAIGLRMGTIAVRALGFGELVLCGASLVHPSAATAGALACAYGLFAGVSLLLHRRQAACGCFGEGDAPASLVQSASSLVLALIGVAAAAAPPHGIGWLLHRSPAIAAVLAAGIAACAYAVVLVYTVLTPAWSSWSRT